MRIFFSGVGGVGIGPLAEIAFQAGDTVVGSDIQESLMTQQLGKILLHIGPQTGDFLREQHQEKPFDYFVHTSALSSDHAELRTARELGIPCAKRDVFIAHFLTEHNLQMIAIAGTHGKTTTTGMCIWAMQQLGIPVSYSVGTTLSFGASGTFDPESRYFVYEADEFDRNFLHFAPELSVITSLDYDHPDTYPTRDSYFSAFDSFIDQSEQALTWASVADELGSHSNLKILKDDTPVNHLRLAGLHNRRNAYLVEQALRTLFPELNQQIVIDALNAFPGTMRRFEKLADNLYTDYAHHPSEIAATIQLAHELSPDVVVVYQPHQNIRQHELLHGGYGDCFTDAQKVYWLPTYLSREDPSLNILAPEEIIAHVPDNQIITPVQMNDKLWRQIVQHTHDGQLVVLMSAGDLDGWARQQNRL